MDDQQQTPDLGSKSSSKAVVTIAIVAVIAIALIGYFLTRSKATSDNTTAVQGAETTAAKNSDVPAAAPNSSSTSGTTYKDGTYTADGDYQSPGGDETINVKLTLKDGTVTDVTVTGNTRNSDDEHYQGLFIGGVKDAVVGKKIDGLKLSRVSGSSLTPMGFNDAVSKIQAQAKS